MTENIVGHARPTDQRKVMCPTDASACSVQGAIAMAIGSRPDGVARVGAMPDDEADVGPPSGSASPDAGVDARRVLEQLGETECMELLATGGMGRLVFISRYGPTALPVMYKIDAGSIVLGAWAPVIDEDLRTGIADADYQVAVEADQIDPHARRGWIVMARGAAHHLDTEAERAGVIDAGLGPWIEEVPAHYIRVTPTTIFGVRVRQT